MAMRTGSRWTTLVKLPVALSGRSRLNSEPVAGAMRCFDAAGQARAVEGIDLETHRLAGAHVRRLVSL